MATLSGFLGAAAILLVPLDVECIDVSRAAAAADVSRAAAAAAALENFLAEVVSGIVSRIVLAACTCCRVGFACIRQTTVVGCMCHRTVVVHIEPTPFLVFPNNLLNLTIPALTVR